VVFDGDFDVEGFIENLFSAILGGGRGGGGGYLALLLKQ